MTRLMVLVVALIGGAGCMPGGGSSSGPEFDDDGEPIPDVVMPTSEAPACVQPDCPSDTAVIEYMWINSLSQEAYRTTTGEPDPDRPGDNALFQIACMDTNGDKIQSVSFYLESGAVQQIDYVTFDILCADGASNAYEVRYRDAEDEQGRTAIGTIERWPENAPEEE